MKWQFTMLILCMLINTTCSAASIGGSAAGLPYKHVFHNGTGTLLKELNGKAMKARVAELLRLRRPELVGWHVEININTDEALGISVSLPMLDSRSTSQVFDILFGYMEERRKGLTSIEAMKALKVRPLNERPGKEVKEGRKREGEGKPLPEGSIPGIPDNE